MPQPRASNARHALRREEILRAAASVFAARGYDRASMEDIGDALGMRAAALYYYFSSKDALLAEICRIGMTEFLEGLKAVAAVGGPARDKIRLGIRAHLTPLVARRFYVSTFLNSRRALPKRLRRPLDHAARRYEALWRRLIRDGQRRGEIPAAVDPALAAFAILGMCNTVARSRTVAARGLDRLAESFASLVCEGLIPR